MHTYITEEKELVYTPPYVEFKYTAIHYPYKCAIPLKDRDETARQLAISFPKRYKLFD